MYYLLLEKCDHLIDYMRFPLFFRSLVFRQDGCFGDTRTLWEPRLCLVLVPILLCLQCFTTFTQHKSSAKNTNTVE